MTGRALQHVTYFIYHLHCLQLYVYFIQLPRIGTNTGAVSKVSAAMSMGVTPNMRVSNIEYLEKLLTLQRNKYCSQ